MPKIPKSKLNGEQSGATRWRVDNVVDGLAGMCVPIGDLTLDPMNARLHPERNIEAIMRSLHLYGQRHPVVVNRRTGHVQAGNGRVVAARRMGWTKVAAVFVDDDEATAAGFGLADNRTAELAKWDESVVARLERLIRELTPEGGDDLMVGWTDEELTKIRLEAPGCPTEFPEVDETVEVQHECPRCGYRYSGGKTVEVRTGGDEEDGGEREAGDEESES